MLVRIVCLLLAVVVVTDAACPSGWTHHNDQCYLFGHDVENWPDAMYMCKLLGGYLAEPMDATEGKFLSDQAIKLNTPFWLGGADVEDEGQWKWMTSGRSLTGGQAYTHWRAGEPNNVNTDENCLHLEQAGSWNDQHCGTSTMKYICQRSFSGEEVIVG